MKFVKFKIFNTEKMQLIISLFRLETRNVRRVKAGLKQTPIVD